MADDREVIEMELKLVEKLNQQYDAAKRKVQQHAKANPAKVSLTADSKELDKAHKQAESLLKKRFAMEDAHARKLAQIAKRAAGGPEKVGAGQGALGREAQSALNAAKKMRDLERQAGAGPEKVGAGQGALGKEAQKAMEAARATAAQRDRAERGRFPSTLELGEREKTPSPGGGAWKWAKEEDKARRPVLNSTIDFGKKLDIDGRQLDKAGKSLNGFDKMLARISGGGGGGRMGRFFGAMGDAGGGGGAVGGTVLAIQLLKAGAEKAADAMKRFYEYGREGAAMLNPRGEQTLRLHKEMFQMEAGRSLLGNQRAEANAAEKGTQAMKWLNEHKDGLLAGAGHPGAGWNNNPLVRKYVPFGASAQDAFNQSPAAQAGNPGGGEQFEDMAAWHRSVTQSNLSMGVAERMKWREQAMASLDDANRPRNNPNQLFADDDAVRQIVDAINGLNVGLGALWLRAVNGG